MKKQRRSKAHVILDREQRRQDDNGISAEMMDKMTAVFAEGTSTGLDSLRALFYCMYREARLMELSYKTKASK
jgi:hypothetical protein